MSQDLRVGGGTRRHNLRVTSPGRGSGRPAAPRLPLRERKKQRILAEIQRAALRLFAKQGYEETTIEQIAEAVEVSPSTVYRYFPTKEDLVLTDEYDPLIIAAIAGGPAEEPPIAAVRRALTENLRGIVAQDPSMFLTRGRLMLAVPTLRARLWDFLQQNEEVLYQIFAAHSRGESDDFELRVAAGAIIGAIMSALTEWVRNEGNDDMADLLERALRQLEVGLAQPGR
jgi:AcrR family transcriptional regulator